MTDEHSNSAEKGQRSGKGVEALSRVLKRKERNDESDN